MIVTLIDCTRMGNPREAAALLISAKATRLEMNPNKWREIVLWSDSKIASELNAIADTIPSCWEFIDYTFLIQGVTRAFTHQFVRTRHASFAQQTMRVLRVSEGPGWNYGTGPSIQGNPDLQVLYDQEMDDIAATYNALIDGGAAIEDARGVLPTNIETNIMVKMNLRTLIEMVRKRESPRVQGEYRDVLHQLKMSAVQEHPFLSIFLARTEDVLYARLQSLINGNMPDNERRLEATKLVDQLKTR